MSTARPAIAPADSPPEPPAGPHIEWVVVSKLRTQLQHLRSERRPRVARPPQLQELPLRVVATEDGAYELLDGFKRLVRWRRLGLERVPVVVETPRSTAEQMIALEEQIGHPALYEHVLYLDEVVGKRGGEG